MEEVRLVNEGLSAGTKGRLQCCCQTESQGTRLAPMVDAGKVQKAEGKK